MTLMPILGRELLQRSRGQANYWTRFCVALAGILVSVESIQVNSIGSPAMMGRFVFNGIVGAAFLVSCSACLLTADAISGEWREGTLSLLFLTRVKVVDVLLGKLGSIGLAALCALLAFLPVLMVPVLAGGVTGGEAFRKGLGLVDTLLLALAIGLFSSSAERERFRAVRNSIVLLCVIVLVPFFAYVGWGRGLFFDFGLLSPIVLLLRAGDLVYTSTPGPYWVSILAVHLMSWFLIRQAGVRLRRAATGERGEGDLVRGREVKAPDRTVGLGVWQPVKAEASLVEWLVYRQYGIHAGIWGLAVLALAANAWVPLVRQAQGISSGPFLLAVASPLGTIAGLIGGAIVGWVASRFFVAVRRSGDLELLLTTPIGAKSIVDDQWKVLKRLFVWPVLYLQAPMLPQFLIGLSALHANSGLGLRPDLGLLKLLTIANSFLGAAALCRLGLWFGLRTRTQATAIVWTAGLGQGLPSLFALVCSLISANELNSPNPSAHGYLLGWWIPELVTCLFYLWLIAISQRGLAGELTGREATWREKYWLGQGLPAT